MNEMPQSPGPEPTPVPLYRLPPRLMIRRLKFWREAIPERLRFWWVQHWWPAKIRQLDRERADWKRWYQELCEKWPTE